MHISLTSRSVVPRATNVESRSGLGPDVCIIPVQANDTTAAVPPVASTANSTYPESGVVSKNLNSIWKLREPAETGSPHPIAAVEVAAIESAAQMVRMTFSMHKGMQILRYRPRTTLRRVCDVAPALIEIQREPQRSVELLDLSPVEAARVFDQ